MRFDEEFIRSLEARLAKPAPGPAAQLSMAPHPRPGQGTEFEEPESRTQAAVAILLYPRHERIHTVLMRRTHHVLHHRDQIGFPGGQIEGDETIDEAALRETHEELGIEPECVRIIGHITPLYIPVSDFFVHPVVAECGEPPAFIPDPIEVAEIIEVPLLHLIDPASVRRETWGIRDIPVEVPYYAYGEHKIWGATAMILAEFVEIVRSIVMDKRRRS